MAAAPCRATAPCKACTTAGAYACVRAYVNASMQCLVCVERYINMHASNWSVGATKYLSAVRIEGNGGVEKNASPGPLLAGSEPPRMFNSIGKCTHVWTLIDAWLLETNKKQLQHGLTLKCEDLALQLLEQNFQLVHWNNQMVMWSSWREVWRHDSQLDNNSANKTKQKH